MVRYTGTDRTGPCRDTVPPHGSIDVDERERLRQQFNRDFARWKIVLPVDANSPGAVWRIIKRGWII